ncbi:hypothetical protein FRAAL3170 [Frankia alni ACN14a]|uniref:Uncharacterized protein n=1 Tax=Frankia alni (strain DSM 45986 / CECT 9034 / ACN14a) TaxID=326424 RepID=Q0RKZ1_FRAAA|nr:hypothetical protein FRAAL3170 [Frankia alni ACN14a]
MTSGRQGWAEGRLGLFDTRRLPSFTLGYDTRPVQALAPVADCVSLARHTPVHVGRSVRPEIILFSGTGCH